MVAIHWFRQDLRLNDNPALNVACATSEVIPIYIYDTVNPGYAAMGAASRWWLHHSLLSLAQDLDDKLLLRAGNPIEIITELCKKYKVNSVFWNRCYEPWQVKRDSQIKKELNKIGIEVNTYNASLLWEPWTITKTDKTPYKVFTPFYKKGCLNAAAPRMPILKPAQIICKKIIGLDLSALKLLPKIPWDQNLSPYWQIGEHGAWRRLEQFLDCGIRQYKEGRNQPAKPFVSRLSPHIHFGEISPHQIWHELHLLQPCANTEHFCSELGWREFSYNLLYFNPELPEKNLQKKFDKFPWKENKQHLLAWQYGKTGIPMVDAGMRELWQTGFMHNRVRMIVGSFLIKNLQLHWHHGERWFWDTLVDADLANNSASWQWVAGCGADAAPYFRIFNPVTQGEKFDPNGEYIKKYLPELAQLPTKYLYSPWLAPAEILSAANITLGKNYPYPIIDLKKSREQALAAFASLKE